jgi:hypothetical protein
MTVAATLDQTAKKLVDWLDFAIAEDQRQQREHERKSFKRHLEIGEYLELLEAAVGKPAYIKLVKGRWGASRATLYRSRRLWEQRYKIMSEANKRNKTYPDDIGVVEALEWAKEAKVDKDALKRKAQEWAASQTQDAKQLLSRLGKEDKGEDEEEVKRQKSLELLRANTQRQLGVELTPVDTSERPEEPKHELQEAERTPIEGAPPAKVMQWAFQLHGFLDPLEYEPSYLASGLQSGDIPLRCEVDGKLVPLTVTKVVVEK